jgi:hypothetical protein
MAGNDAFTGVERQTRSGLSRAWYRVMCVVEIIAILIVIFVLTVPIQDYALREFKEWLSHPSPETLAAFRSKQQEEPRFRLMVSAPFVALAVLLAFPLYRLRSEPKN